MNRQKKYLILKEIVTQIRKHGGGVVKTSKTFEELLKMNMQYLIVRRGKYKNIYCANPHTNPLTGESSMTNYSRL